MGIAAIAFVLDILITSITLFIAAWLRSEKMPWVQMIIILFVASAFALIPIVGVALSLGVFFVLLVKYTELTSVDALWVVIVAKSLALAFLVLAGVRWGDGPSHFLNFPSSLLSDFFRP